MRMSSFLLRSHFCSCEILEGMLYYPRWQLLSCPCLPAAGEPGSDQVFLPVELGMGGMPRKNLEIVGGMIMDCPPLPYGVSLAPPKGGTIILPPKTFLAY